MPRAGIEPRAEQLATLARIRHERLISDELGRLIETAGAELNSAPYDSDEASLVRVARRTWEKARRGPGGDPVPRTRRSRPGLPRLGAGRGTPRFAAVLLHLYLYDAVASPEPDRFYAVAGVGD